MDRPPEQDVDALLFDLGGVVIEIDFGRCFAAWGEASGRAAEDIAAAFTADDAYEAHEVGRLDAAGYFASVRASLGLALDDDVLLAGWCDIYLGVVDGIVPLLDAAARHRPLYAFTNTNPSHVAAYAERFADQLHVFRRVFTSSDLGLRKPEAEAFHAVADAIGVEPGRVLFLDDSPANVEGALAAGLQAVHVTTVDATRAALEARSLV
jgi:putative hydrolase of the HAD superfamily